MDLLNGVRCVAAEMPEAPLTCLDLWCRAGSFTEMAGEEGMAHFLEHMVFKGSDRLEAGAFDLAIEALGGSSNAATGFDDVHFHVLIPPDQSQQALDLLLDLVLHQPWSRNPFVWSEVVLEEMTQYADQPDEQVLQQLLKQGCPDHPYGRPILGKRSSLLAMEPEAMRTFHQSPLPRPALLPGHRWAESQGAESNDRELSPGAAAARSVHAHGTESTQAA